MVDDAEIEKTIQDKGLNAPRITPQMIEELIAGEYCATADKMFPGAPILPGMEIFTVSILVLKNGFIVSGHSAPASPENFDAELGRRLARQHAINQIWPLEGYRLKCDLANQAEFDKTIEELGSLA